MALNWRFGSNGSLYANKFLKRKGDLSNHAYHGWFFMSIIKFLGVCIYLIVFMERNVFMLFS